MTWQRARFGSVKPLVRIQLSRLCRNRSTGGAPVLKTGSPKGYVGSNPSCGVFCPWPKRIGYPATNRKAAGSSPAGQTVAVAQWYSSGLWIRHVPVRIRSVTLCRHGEKGITAAC